MHLVASSTDYKAALITVGVVVAFHRTGVTVSTRVSPWLIKVIIGRGIVVVRRRGEVVVVDRAGLRSGSWTRFRRLRRLWRIIRRWRRIVAIVAEGLVTIPVARPLLGLSAAIFTFILGPAVHGLAVTDTL